MSRQKTQSQLRQKVRTKAQSKSRKKLSQIGQKIMASEQNIKSQYIDNANYNKQAKPKQQYKQQANKQADNDMTNYIRPNNQRIQKLVDKLYPRLDESYEEISLSRKKSSLIFSPYAIQNQDDKNDVFLDDPYVSHRKFQNKMSMNTAQRQLDKRLKSRVLEKAKNIKNGVNEPYKQIYKRYKTQRQKQSKSKSKNQILDGDILNISSQGIKYYDQLKKMPTFLEYTKQKIKQITQQKGMSTKITSVPLLKSLSSRKRKKVVIKAQSSKQSQRKAQSEQKLHDSVNFKQKWLQNIYNEELDNIHEISDRLKRIYSRGTKLRMNDQQFRQIQKSNIIKHQHKILQELHQNPERINVKNKEKLINKFNQILNQFGRSIVSRRPQLRINVNSTLSKQKLNSQITLDNLNANTIMDQRKNETINHLQNQSQNNSQIRSILRRQNNRNNMSLFRKHAKQKPNSNQLITL